MRLLFAGPTCVGKTRFLKLLESEQNIVGPFPTTKGVYSQKHGEDLELLDSGGRACDLKHIKRDACVLVHDCDRNDPTVLRSFYHALRPEALLQVSDFPIPDDRTEAFCSLSRLPLVRFCWTDPTRVGETLNKIVAAVALTKRRYQTQSPKKTRCPCWSW